jgi:rhamnulokinase
LKHMLGLDCGNSSFRIFLGTFDGEAIRMEMIDQQPNFTVKIGEYEYWDVLNIFEGFKRALRVAALQARIDSIGVCTWGVDFALFTKEGAMLGNPLCYRNTIGARTLDGLDAVQREKLFGLTGILCDKINSVYMLGGIRELMPSLYGAADKLLMVPDILNYMLTGVMQNEPSELSTTQLMDARSKRISSEACEFFGLNPSLFCEIGRHGRRIGFLRGDIRGELGIGYDIPVICVPSHDTACAVLAVPAEESGFAFVSSGTWSLIGTELSQPVVTRAAMDSALTNEVGAFDRVTLLRNNAGMFMMQRIRAEINAERGTDASWEELTGMAETAREWAPFDVNDPRFFNPPSMSGAIREALRENGNLTGEADWSVVIRSVYESLAESYAVCVNDLETVTGRRFNKLYIVGGGARNDLLNRLSASHTKRAVVACEGESTVLGNIAAQIAYFREGISPEELRSIMSRSSRVKVYG